MVRVLFVAFYENENSSPLILIVNVAMCLYHCNGAGVIESV